MVVLPFTGFPKESMDVVLEGRSVRVRSRFSNLVDTWSLDLIALDGDTPVTLFEGVVVTIGADIFAPYALSLGGLFAEAGGDGTNVDPNRNELGRRVRLIHYTSAELAAK